MRLFTFLLFIFLYEVFNIDSLYSENKPGDGPLNNEFPGPEEYIEQPFDVLSYFVELDISEEPMLEASGKCAIDFLIKGAPDTSDFYFNLRSMQVDSLFYYGVKRDIEEIGAPDSADYHFEVALTYEGIPEENITRGDTARIVIYYSGSMTNEGWGGVRFMENILFALGVGFSNNYVSCTQHWAPCYDHPADKAKFRGRFKVKKGLTVASIGLLKAKEELDGKVIYDWVHDYDCSTYLYTFNAGEFVEMQFGDGELPMLVYSTANDSAAARYAFHLLPDMVNAFEERFGKYPFDKVGYALTPDGSMEHQTMISYAPNVITKQVYKDSMNNTAAHELAHMWFGDMVSPLDFREAWLNEGFAVFCEAVWHEYIFGYESYLDYISESMIENYIKKNSKFDGIIPLYDFPRETVSNYPQTIYNKGGAVVAMLRYELGDDVFFKAIKAYLNHFAYSGATTEGLKNILEQESGKDLTQFFKQWVYGIGWPQLDVDIVSLQKDADGLNNVKITVAQVQDNDQETFMHVPFEVGFMLGDGSYHWELMTIDEKEQEFLLDSIPDFTLVEINRGPTVRALLEVKSLTSARESGGIFESLTVYPNPSDDTIFLEFNSHAGRTDVKLIDMKGSAVYMKRIYTGEGENTLAIKTDGIPSGSYILSVQNSAGTKSVSVKIAH